MAEAAEEVGVVGDGEDGDERRAARRHQHADERGSQRTHVRRLRGEQVVQREVHKVERVEDLCSPPRVACQ